MVCEVVTSFSLRGMYFSCEEGALSMRRPNFVALASCRDVYRREGMFLLKLLWDTALD